jgi:hypothetical protein
MVSERAKPELGHHDCRLVASKTGKAYDLRTRVETEIPAKFWVEA